tara:strand:+ start:489 stop:920 length:432 start_codon:yes stop_codon:yes gene_type:complete
MTAPVEFGSFYKLLREVIRGNVNARKELEWLLAEYEHAKDATSAYDELGQIFCHHGIMELYEYTGTDNIEYINSLDGSVWEYLKVRMEVSLSEFMVRTMIRHAKHHNLTQKISEKWNAPISDIQDNIEDLASYVVDGIVEIIL